MTKGTTKKALVLSVLSMLVCCAMLIGSTFAWFSDEATAGKNKIVAGNLDVELLDAAGNKLVDTIFDETTLWEPGVMEVSKTFKVANQGNLALWYDMTLAVVEETLINGHSLTEVVKMKVVAANAAPNPADTLEERIAAWEALDGTSVQTQGTLAPNTSSDALVVVLFWAPNDNITDNQFNLKDGTYTDDTAPSITFALSVYATQTPSEEDSFGPNYDEHAKDSHNIYAAVAAGVNEMNALMANGGYAQLSQLVEEITEEGTAYVSTVTIFESAAAGVVVRDVYDDIGETLFGKVIEQSASIKKIAVKTSYEEYPEAELVTDGRVITTDELVRLVADSLGGTAGQVAGREIIDLKDNYICVTITDMGDISHTYRLEFVTVAVNDTIHDTVVNGIDKVNNDMEYAQLSPLEEVGENEYVTYVTVTDEETTVGRVYGDISATLFGEVLSQAANIQSITIVTKAGDEELGRSSVEEMTEKGLLNAIKEAAGDDITINTTLAELIASSASITVTIVDVNNVSLSYTLMF